MIYRLRKKFIVIVTVSFLAVFFLLLMGITVFTRLQTNAELDALADVISDNNGRFPTFEESELLRDPPKPPHAINRESSFTTRFFTVKLDPNGECIFTDVRSVASISQEEAAEYAKNVLASRNQRGWNGDFRYKKIVSENGTEIIFVSGANIKNTNRNFMIISVAVFLAGSLIALALVVFLSKWAVKPTAESYEKQKQFITNANHELKTPLTLIRTNLEIMESEFGQNEWLTDIKDETETMTELVNHLVTLAHMDEENTELSMTEFDLSEAVSETVSIFFSLAEKAEKSLSVQIEPGILYTGDETALRRLVSILMDNAVKYCDPNGSICVALHSGKHPVLTVDNTYSAIKNVELNRLFDRFYRADSARTAGSGFGVGLSIAKSITQQHRGSISAIQKDEQTIRFQIKL